MKMLRHWYTCGVWSDLRPFLPVVAVILAEDIYRLRAKRETLSTIAGRHFRLTSVVALAMLAHFATCGRQ